MHASRQLSGHVSSRCASAAALAIALLASPAAWGQAGQATKEDLVEAEGATDVVVTGSRIERAGFDQPTPTTVIGSVELRQGARPNLQQILNDQPQFRATVTPQVSNGNTATGTAPVDLRGLGTVRTLTLLNGRRFAGENNLNFIPTSLVQRLEVVTGGASAAWGSGAVAGVVNIILKDDLDGVTVGAQSGISSRGDGFRYGGDIAFGTSFADGRGHFMAGAEYIDDKGIPDRNTRANLGSAGIVRVNALSTTDLSTQLVRDVNFGNTARDGLITSGVLAGQVFNQDGTLRPFRGGTRIGAAAFPAQMIGGEDGVGLYDGIAVSTPFDRLSVYARASYDIGGAKFWVDGTYGRATTDNRFLPDFTVPALTIRATNPFLSQTIRNQLAAAGQTSFTFGRFFDDAFFFNFDSTRENKEVAIGVDGEFAGGRFKYSAHYSHGVVDTDQKLENSRIAANFTRAIDAVSLNGQIVCAVNADAITTNDDPACRPFNPFGRNNASAEALAYVTGTQQLLTTNKLDSVGFEVQGDLFNLWAGPVIVAIGAEGRRETQTSSRNAQAIAGIFGLPVYTSDLSGSFHVAEGFGEIAVPVVDFEGVAKLDLNGAARYSDYSNSGGIWSWKAGGTLRLFDDVLLRATRSRDIRSPNLSDLFTTRRINIGPLVDQNTAGRLGVIAGYNATPQTVTTFSGGNPNLQPEISQGWTVGGSFSPRFFSGFNLSVDYYDIRINGAITTLSASNLTLACARGNQQACDQIIRNPTTQTVETVFSNAQNIASFETSGFDIEASYLMPLDRLNDRWTGQLRLRALANHVRHFIFDTGITRVDTAGDVGDATANSIPKWRGTVSVSYIGDSFSFDVRARYVDGGLYNRLLTTLVNNEIGSRTYVDLGAQFKVAEDFTFFGNVNNLFDRDPPLITSGSPHYDVVGTYVTFGARVNF